MYERVFDQFLSHNYSELFLLKNTCFILHLHWSVQRFRYHLNIKGRHFSVQSRICKFEDKGSGYRTYQKQKIIAFGNCVSFWCHKYITAHQTFVWIVFFALFVFLGHFMLRISGMFQQLSLINWNNYIKTLCWVGTILLNTILFIGTTVVWISRSTIMKWSDTHDSWKHSIQIDSTTVDRIES